MRGVGYSVNILDEGRSDDGESEESGEDNDDDEENDDDEQSIRVAILLCIHFLQRRSKRSYVSSYCTYNTYF